MNQELERIKGRLDSHFLEEEELSAVDVAEYLKILKKHDEDEYADYLSKIDPANLGDVAIEMPDHMLKDVIDNVSNDKLVEAFEELESDDATDLLQYIKDIDEEKANEIFCSLDIENQKEISKLLNYDDDQAGAYMQTELFAARLDEKLSSAIARFRLMKQNEEIENVFQIFVVDNDGILKYAIPLEDLIVYDFDLKMENIVKNSTEDKYKPHFACDIDKIEDVVTSVMEYDLSVIGIVNKAGVLVGRITTDDIHDIIEERATEQIYNLAGVDNEAESEDTTIGAAKARGLWLFINMITSLVSASVISLFSGEIEKLVALAALMPIVASMGGNTGSQALAVTVRRLALGEIEFEDAKRVILREIQISLLNGFIFAVVMGIIAYVWFGMVGLGFVIALSMVLNLGLAGFIGSFIPLTLKKFGIDPAVGSSVLLTAITDALGFFSFLGLAKWLLL